MLLLLQLGLLVGPRSEGESGVDELWWAISRPVRMVRRRRHAWRSQDDRRVVPAGDSLIGSPPESGRASGCLPDRTRWEAGGV